MTHTFTLLQYKTWVRNKIGDPSFDDPSLTQFAGDVNAEICNSVAWPFMEADFDGTITSATNSYEQPTDLQQPIDIQVIDPSNSIIYLDYMPYSEFNQRYPSPANGTPSAPSVWTTFAGNLILGPSFPNQTYTLDEKYIKVPTFPTSDSATLDVPDDFRELVVLGMYSRALEASDQPDYAVAQDKKFQYQLGLMKQRYGVRQSGTALVVQTRRSLLRGLPRGR